MGELFPALLDFASQVKERAKLCRLGIDLKLGFEAIADGQDLDSSALAGSLCATRSGDHLAQHFPLRPFQEAVVKDRAYDPDWGSGERLQASIDAIAIAEAICDPSQPCCSLSTIPGTYLPWGESIPSDQQMADQLGKWVQAAWQHRNKGGRRMVLCIEPEPLCSWGSTPTMLQFWQTHRESIAVSAKLKPMQVSDFIACCWDTCHASVLFEDQASSIQALATSGLTPLKVQYSAAPRCATADNITGIAALCAMEEPRFCHQVGLRHADGRVEVLEDLPDLATRLVSWQNGVENMPQQVSTHFHIPVNTPPQSPLLQSSVGDSDVGLATALAKGAEHVSVETYTWNLQAEHTDDMIAGTAAEVRHLADRLLALGVSI